MNSSKAILASLVLALALAAPTAALARNGADDAPDTADDNGGLRAPGTSDDSTTGSSSTGGGSTKAKRVSGSCTANATAKLKAKPDDGRLETEFEVDQNRNGVTWTVSIRRNDKVVVSTKATTRAPSGSFSVERRIANPAGADRISARAVSSSGQVCTASLTV
jgi:hypothetical protein